MGEQLHAAQPKRNVSFIDAGVGMDSNVSIVGASVLALTRANISMPGTTLISVPASTSIIMSAHSSAVYGAGTVTYEAIGTTIASVSTSMLIPKLTVPPADPAISKLIDSVSAVMSITTPSHTSASASFIAQECRKLSHIVTQLVTMIFIIICWY